MKVLIIDNYDSFTYNLVHLIEGCVQGYEVWRNDEINFGRVQEFDAIVLSPGPGIPGEAGQMPELIKRFADVKPILGVCLGCQALGEYFEAHLFNMNTVMHGVQTSIRIVDNSCLYKGLTSEIKVGRYHSWALQIENFSDLIPTAYDEDGVLMSFRHNSLPIYGIQYHPESIMTPEGKQIIENWISLLTS